MKIKEPGHIYELDQLDTYPDTPPQFLFFVNRETGHEHAGTQTQDVIRALIDRTQHCDRCLRWDGNDLIVHHLRMALALHEARALLRKTEKGILRPEKVMVNEDGHFLLVESGKVTWPNPVTEDPVMAAHCAGCPPRASAIGGDPMSVGAEPFDIGQDYGD